jgi:preprotein translocase subunit Sec61beta
MTTKKYNVSTPMSSAGIMGITAQTEMGGFKFDPKAVVLFAAIFIVLVKLGSYVIG